MSEGAPVKPDWASSAAETPAIAPPAGAVLDHGGMVDAAHHLAAGAVIFGDAQRVAGGVAVKPQQARAGGGGCDRAPGAGGMVVGGGGVLGNRGAGAEFITHGERGEDVFAGETGRGKRQQRGQQRAADMALGGVEAVMAIEAVDAHARGKGDTGGRGGAGVKEHRLRARELAAGMGGDDVGEPGHAGRGGDADEIEQRQAGH